MTGVASGMSSTSSKTSSGSGSAPAAPAPPDAGQAGGRGDLPETVAVGRVLRPHGLRGEVVVAVLTDAPRRFDPGSALVLTREGRPPLELVVAARRAEASPRVGQATVLLRFGGIEDREAAVALRGGWLEIDRSLVPPAPPGTYYHYELLGCRCASGGEDLGEVVEVVEDGGGLLLVISDGRRELPVPFAARFLRAVDVERARIELELPAGLIETCAFRR